MTIQYSGLVKPQWLDYNGHMNLAYYVLAFDLATDAFYQTLGIGEQYIESEKRSMFTTEINVCYKQELLSDEEFYVRTTLKDFNGKLVHYLHQMYRSSNDQLVAINECLAIHVDMQSRRSTTMSSSILTKLQRVSDSQASDCIADDFDWRLAIRK